MKFFLSFLMMLTLTACNEKTTAAPVDSTRNLSIIASNGRRHDFKIELALTAQQQIHGLMNRTEMDEDAGMMFFFAREEPRSFWMKNTLIPLDMIFIARDGTIINVHDSAIPGDLTGIKSEAPAIAVLELNGGIAKKLKIQAGDKIHHPFFGS